MRDNKYADLTLKALKQRITYLPETGMMIWADGEHKGCVAGWIDQVGRVKPYRKVDLGLYGTHYLHRLAYFWMTGHWPPQLIDHINCETLDNRWQNLRAATHQQNTWNVSLPANHKTGVIGVCWDKRRNKWLMKMRRGSDLPPISKRYDDFDAAVAARREAERLYRVW